MTKLIHRLKRLPSFLSSAFFITAAFLFLINTITLFPFSQTEELYRNFSSGVFALFGVLSGGFITFYTCKNTKKAFFSAGSIMLFDLMLFSLCGVHISLISAIVLSLVFSFIFEKQSLLNGFIICLLISFISAFALGLGYDSLFTLLKALCSFLKGRGALFGAVNNAYSLIFSDNLSALFYHKDYSGSAYSNGKIVSGVIDMFSARKAAGINASKYLSGKYFVNVFLSTGVFALVYQRLEREQKNAFLLCFLLALVFGDVRLFSLFLLIYNPLMYLGWLFLISVSYLTAYMLDIRMVFMRTGSLFELVKYRDKPGYFIIAGLVLCVLSYFAQSIILSKFDFQNRRILSSEVRKIISALGGERNIQRIQGNEIVLKNPNLIDILRIDCEIRGNTVLLDNDDMKLVKEAFIM